MVECVKMAVLSVKDAGRKNDAQEKTQDTLTEDDSWSIDIFQETARTSTSEKASHELHAKLMHPYFPHLIQRDIQYLRHELQT